MPHYISSSQPVAAKPYARSRFENALWFIMLVALGVVGYATRVFLGKPGDQSTLRGISFRSASTLPAVWAPSGWSLAVLGRASESSAGVAPLDWTFLLAVRHPRLNCRIRYGNGFSGGPITIGFGTLAVLWFATAVQAYRYALKGEIDLHRRWNDPQFCAHVGRCQHCASGCP